jgi:hypothetical protein
MILLVYAILENQLENKSRTAVWDWEATGPVELGAAGRKGWGAQDLAGEVGRKGRWR